MYDGRLCKEWMKKNGRPFLEIPGNLLLMINLDWFRAHPFKHTPYNVGVIYLVVLNLPHSILFKIENIIVVASIPGPKMSRNSPLTHV